MNDTPEKKEEKKPLPPMPQPAREYEPVEIDPNFIRSPAMALWFDDRLHQRAKDRAHYLSQAEGFVPPHLIGKPAACFAVISRALQWKLDPYAVANCCYQTPNGKIGFEGKLCQAALEQSGRLEGGVDYDWFGDWEKVEGKFAIKISQKSGKEYPVPTWTREEATQLGLGVIVSAQLKGEAKRRTHKMNLAQCFPLNSTLWATDPHTQIGYTAVRRFCSLAVPGLFMGVEFDHESLDDDSEMVRAARAKDITPPAPTRQEFADPTAGPTAGAEAPPAASTKEGDGVPTPTSPPPSGTEPEPANEDDQRNVSEGGKFFTLTGVPDGDTFDTEDAGEFVTMILTMADQVKGDINLLNGLWDSNSSQFQFLEEGLGQRIRDNWPRVKRPKAPTNPNAQGKIL